METKTINSLLTGFIGLNFADYFLTVRGVAMGATEVNPLMSSIIPNFTLYFFVKLILPLLAVSALVYLIKRCDLSDRGLKIGKSISVGVFTAYLLIVANNTYWVCLTYLR